MAQTPERRVDRVRRIAPRVLVAAAIGPAFWASVPDTDLWWLGFVMWIPWLWMIEDLTPRQAFAYGTITGVSTIAVGFFWMTQLLLRFAFDPEAFGATAMPIAVSVHLLFSCWQGSQWGLAAALLVWLRRRTGVRVLWLMPLAWVVVEAFWPNLFPTYMALAWCWHPRWTQLAELGGVTMVTFAMCSINAALYVLARDLWEGRGIALAPLVAAAAWLVGVPLYGSVRMAQVDAQIEVAPKVRMGVVQGNFGIHSFHDHATEIAGELRRETARLEAEGAQIALWGESAYPIALARQQTTDWPPRGRFAPKRIRRGFTIPLIMGVVTADAEDPDSKWNTAWVLEPDDRLGDRYDKVYLLLFGEAAPSFIDPEWYTRTFDKASNLNRGEGPGVLRVGDWRFGPLICYEDILPRYVREAARVDVHAFVNLTNDSWFGNTREQPEHLGLAVFRTIEQRKAMVRSVNAGISAYIDPAGRVVHRTRVTDSDTDGYRGAEGFVAEVALMEPSARTIYGRTGESFDVLLVLVLAGLALRLRRRE